MSSVAKVGLLEYGIGTQRGQIFSKAEVLEKQYGTLKFGSRVNRDKMMRHLFETAPKEKSYFYNLKDAQKVLDAYNSGDYRLIYQDSKKNSITIQVEGVIGRYVSTGNLRGLPDINLPTDKFMIQSLKSPKVVPVNPKK